MPQHTGRRSWKLEDAKARFGEIVRLAHTQGPQRVSVRGRDSVVVISAIELDRLMSHEARKPLVEFLESLDLNGLDLERSADYGRDPDI